MRKINRLLAVCFITIIASCSSVKVVTDLDKTVDFTQYKSYSFLGWQDNSDKILNEFDKKRLKDALAVEFKARGLEFKETGGDMELSLFIVVNKETSVTAYTNYYNTGYSGYSRYNGGWGNGSATTTYTEDDYLQGTLVLDVFDKITKDQIWQGVATSIITENPAKREKSIPKKVSALMAKFPIPIIKE